MLKLLSLLHLLNIAEIKVDFTLDLIFNSLNIGQIRPTEEELKQTPKTRDENRLNSKYIPIKVPMLNGIVRFTSAKYNTSFPAFFSSENFTSNPAVNIKKTSPIVDKNSIISPVLTKFKPKGPKIMPAKITAVTQGT